MSIAFKVKEIPLSELNRLFYVDSNGVVRNKIDRHFKNKDQIVGTIHKEYVIVCISCKNYYLHRIVYQLQHQCELNSEQIIDHIDGDKMNNLIANLRIATKSENQHNRNASITSKSGIKGVHFCSKAKKYVATIKLNKIRYYLGSYDNIEHASAAHANASYILHGGFANTHSNVNDKCVKVIEILKKYEVFNFTLYNEIWRLFHADVHSN